MGVCSETTTVQECAAFLPPKTPDRKSLWLELDHLWFFGVMTRQEAADLLQGETDTGVFLVRNSNTLHGDIVLSVKEGPRVSHYIIHKLSYDAQTTFKIGERVFPDLPSLLHFYKNHLLDTAPLLRPVTKHVERVRARFNFNGSGDAEDLPFRKGEILTIISKDEELWWTARNFIGETGMIPVNYVEKLEFDVGSSNSTSLSPHRHQPEQPPFSNNSRKFEQAADRAVTGETTLSAVATEEKATTKRTEAPGQRRNCERKPKAKVRVKQERIPNAYDKTALRLHVGDVISVIAMQDNGQWVGVLRGKTGYFPVTHVDFLETTKRDVEL